MRGDKPEAVRLLKQAAGIFAEQNNTTQAERMLRQVARLGGGDEPDPADAPPLIERPLTLAPADADAWCSFCCRPHHEVGPLVAATTGTFICAGCVAKCGAMLTHAPVGVATFAPRPLVPAPAAPDPGATAKLAQVAEKSAKVTQELIALIAELGAKK